RTSRSLQRSTYLQKRSSSSWALLLSGAGHRPTSRRNPAILELSPGLVCTPLSPITGEFPPRGFILVLTTFSPCSTSSFLFSRNTFFQAPCIVVRCSICRQILSPCFGRTLPFVRFGVFLCRGQPLHSGLRSLIPLTGTVPGQLQAAFGGF